MGYSDQFFKALGIKVGAGSNLSGFSKGSGIPPERLKYYNKHNVLPTGTDLEKVVKFSGVSELFLKLKMGIVDQELISLIQQQADSIAPILDDMSRATASTSKLSPVFKTKLGKLYQADCLDLMKQLDSDSIDLIFADPPFNLSKLYPSNINDNLKAENYIQWSQEWLYECIRLLKPGGSLFVWNLPKWNATLAGYLNLYLTFRHWISVDIKYSLPILGRLYPSHYSLLYYVKGEKPANFHPDRLPMQVCPKCFGDIKDYGGYKDKMNPLGINMSDVWTDIPPVRHAKYKRREGANELSLKLLDRVIEMASNEGDVILDPFGGSGTTYIAAELKKRKWIGCEIGPVETISERFSLIHEERLNLNMYRDRLNKLFPASTLENRKKRGLWTNETFK